MSRLQTVDLQGKTIGRLTILYEVGATYCGKRRERNWFCQCSCGEVVTVKQKSLLSHFTQSCGCLQKDRSAEFLSSLTRIPKEKADIDYTSMIGTEYGRWYVLDVDENGACKCQCTCGTVRTLSAKTLLSGKSNSCGCLQREKAREIIKQNSEYQFEKKHNSFDMSHQFGIGKDDNGNQFYFDKADYDLIKDIYFSKDGEGYFTNGNIRLHRLLMGLGGEALVVDHINGNPADNRRDNLRVVTQAENSRNRKVSSRNKSGVTGVRQIGSKYAAYITYDGKQINLGRFDNMEDAVKARKDAEQKYFGDMARRGNAEED